MSRALQQGDVVDVRFPEHDPKGHEQQGYRPAIVVGLPQSLANPRYPVIWVVPLTSDRQQPWADASPALYPRLSAGAANLRSPSIALLDQIRSLDVSRISKYRGTLTSEQYQPYRRAACSIAEGLVTILETPRNPNTAKS